MDKWEQMKQLREECNNLYKKQNELKGQRNMLERELVKQMRVWRRPHSFII